MQKLKILNTREIKEIRGKLKEQFGFEDKLDYAFLINEKDRLFIINRDLARIDTNKLKVDRYGLYLGELKKELRLSMEGAALIGKKANKNVVEISKEELKKYFLGENLSKNLGAENRFVLLSYDQEVIGCAKYKEGELINFLPKIHRSGDVIV